MQGFKPGRWTWNPGKLDYRVKPFLPGLGGLWPLWGNGTTIAHTLVGTNHGTLTNGIAWGRTFRGIGLMNDDASDKYVALTNFSPLELNAITVLAVVRRRIAFNSSHIFGRHSGWFLSGDGTSSSKIRFAVTTSGGEFSTAGYPLASTTQDYCFVGCYDRKTVQLYVDGMLFSSTASTAAMNSDGTMRLGGYGGGALAWPGDISLAAAWPGVALPPGACAFISRHPWSLIKPRRYRYNRWVPNATIAAGGWVDQNSLSADLHSPLAEENPATYVQSPTNPSGNILKLGTSNVTPGPLDSVVITVSAELI